MSPQFPRVDSLVGRGTTWAVTKTHVYRSHAQTVPAPSRKRQVESTDAKTCKRVDLHAKVITPDVLVQPHMASLEMTFYPTSGDFPQSYDGDGFAAEHGSWNREKRTGYEVIRIPMHDGKAEGSYEDFLTGFVVNNDSVWGRPVGVAIGKDGSMFVTDDGSRSVWHVTYESSQSEKTN
jgi:glucose/arabinose dehydrogenase